MNYRSSLLFALAAAVLLLGGGCGGAHKTVLHGGVGPSELLVKQIVVPGGPIPIEGAYSYVRIENPGGDKVIDGRLPSNGRTTIRLAEGAYTLTSYQRTCDGNCGTVDPASDSCSGSFTVSGDKPLSATVRVTFGSGCRIAFAASAE